MAITHNRRWAGARRLESLALQNIKFLGHVSDSERSLMTKACSVIVAALEDYGLVPVEANASGTPVIAYGAGGVLDTQVPETGVFSNGRRRMHSSCTL